MTLILWHKDRHGMALSFLPPVVSDHWAHDQSPTRGGGVGLTGVA
jgi:hypothetical protein